MERWKINLYTLWLSQVISLTSFGFGLPFIPFFIQELGVTDPESIRIYTGILSAAPALTMAFMSPVWGMLSDRFGQKLMIQRAMLAAVFIIGGMGFAQSVAMLIILRFLQGFFTGTVTASSAFVAVNTPNHKLSYALGVLSSSTFIGYSMGPLLGGAVAENFGYRMSFYIGAVLMLVGFLLVTFIVKPIHLPDREQAVRVKVKRKWSELLSVSILMLLLMLFLQRLTRSLFSPFVPLYIQEITGTIEGAASKTGYINGAVGLVSALSAFIISHLSNRYDKVKMIQLMLAIGVGIVLAINLSHSFWVFLILYMGLFLVIGGVEPLLTATTSEMTPAEKRGTLFGVQGLVGSLGWLVSPAIGTYVSVQYGIKEIFWVLIVVLLLNLSVTFAITKRT
ncbi:MFS transporter [Fusibacter sp. JL298sf-3]